MDFSISAKLENQKELNDPYIGTPCYFAPEMIDLDGGQDYCVDWWALGVLIFELVVGVPPFFHKKVYTICYMIQNNDLSWASAERQKIEVSSQLKDLISRLLTKDRTKRLGVNGVDEILSHEWFASIDREKLLKKEL